MDKRKPLKKFDMTEQLISFETAKLAKERGFDEECFNHYVKNNKYPKPFGLEDNYYVTKVVYKKNSCLPYKTPSPYSEIQECTAPTQSLLQKWLREKHNIHFVIMNGWYPESKNIFFEIKMYIHNWMQVGTLYTTYEEALEKGLQEALKLV